MKRFRFLLLLLLVLSILLATLCGCPKTGDPEVGERTATDALSTASGDETDPKSDLTESGDASGEIPADPGYTKRY